MKRRQFITLLGSAATWPLVARAQQPALPVVGALITPSPAEYADRMVAFRRGLRDAGFTEGQNVTIEYRWANNQLDRIPALLDDLVGRKPAAIFVTGDALVAVPAAKAATQTIPIVFTTGSDPVAAGFVASLNRPGGNLTGVTGLAVEIGPKRLELLHEITPTVGKIALLSFPDNQTTAFRDTQDVLVAARRLGLEIIILSAGTENEIDRAFATMAQQRIGALFIGSDAFFDASRERIAKLALRRAIATFSSSRRGAEAGELMSYGSSSGDAQRQAGVYIGRILKGEKPADLPIVQPTKFELVINLKTAKALGLTVPETLLATADEVIQ
jgi:putative ABC transport system substrate-binding protein